MEVIEDLAQKAEECKSQYVVLVFDEMKVKEDLVYNKHTGQLVGYVNLGHVEQQLSQLENSNQSPGEFNVATHVLAFMLRGLCTKLDYCIGHFATSKLSGEELFSMTWNVIEQAEGAGFKVMAITADGAAANRKFFKMHQDPTGSNVTNGVVYKTNNIFAAEERSIYFMSDVPHLIKTARNSWEKSKFGGKKIMKVKEF